MSVLLCVYVAVHFVIETIKDLLCMSSLVYNKCIYTIIDCFIYLFSTNMSVGGPLFQLVFRRHAHDRSVTFSDVSQAARIPQSEVSACNASIYSTVCMYVQVVYRVMHVRADFAVVLFKVTGCQYFSPWPSRKT